MPPIERDRPLRVLLVEDDPDLAEATAEFLRLEALDVRVAASGRDALESAAAFQPQLVLCDLHLPDMPGLDLVRRLRTDPSTAGTYIAILTALRERDLTDRPEAGEQHADAFISKPLTFDAVRRLKEILVSGRRTR
jgi:two-component system alkaline phosphatase synthesis response regulator PhoP